MKGNYIVLEKVFHLKEHQTTASREIVAGMITFFAMSYILFVNPEMLSQTGMPFQAVFLATIIASVVGTLIMGLFANVPYAQAPGMGLNAFFTFTICFGMGYSWQQALGIVFLCGVINVLITVTHVRKKILAAIPKVIQHAIGAGIGVFIAYVGVKNAGFLNFTIEKGNILSATVEKGEITTAFTNGGITPSLTLFQDPGTLVALCGLIITLVLVLKKVPGAMLIGIIFTTVIAIIMGVVDLSHINMQANSLQASLHDLKTTFLAAFSSEGLPSLFTNVAKIPQVLMTVLAFSLSDIFDTIGSLIGTNRKSGAFMAEEKEAKQGYTSMDKALLADSCATMTASVFGTSNVITYVESAAGIAAGGRTGLTAVTVAILFMLSSFFAPLISIVPSQATAPVLIIVGIMMAGSFTEIRWDDLEEAIPAFFTAIFMGFCYSIAYGIAAGFIFYCLTKIVTNKAKEIKPMLWIVTLLFILNFIMQALM